MTHSTATEPVPAVARRATWPAATTPTRPRCGGCRSSSTRWRRTGRSAPRATDMAHFMIAQLNDGQYGAASILSPATMAQMHQRSFAADPRLAGYAHGFMDRIINGHRVLMHDGSWEGFESVLMLVPGCHLGLFISANATGGIGCADPGAARPSSDRFVPAPATPDAIPTPAATAPGTAMRAAGRLLRAGPAQRVHSGETAQPARAVPARIDPDGTVHFKGKIWTTSGDGLYQPADGSDHLVFLRGPDGQRYVATDGPDYQLMSAGETLPFNLGVLLGLRGHRHQRAGRAADRAGPAVAAPTGRPPRRWRLARALAGGGGGAGRWSSWSPSCSVLHRRHQRFPVRRAAQLPAPARPAVRGAGTGRWPRWS